MNISSVTSFIAFSGFAVLFSIACTESETDPQGSSSSSGTGGAGGSGCVPSAEICNGLDDDCDGATDTGCPAGVELANGDFGSHMLFGNMNGGVPFEDLCPPGSALYRFEGSIGDTINRIDAYCGVLELATDTASTPYGYTVARGMEQPLESHGTTPGSSSYDLECPPDQFIVGIEGDATTVPATQGFDGGVHKLIIHCAELLIEGTPGSFAVNYGPTTTFTASAVSDQGGSFGDLLGAPKVVDRYRGRSGGWQYAIGIGDADVMVSLVE